MFDFRYHALSLAAVLIALTVGVLLGVAIGDSNLVSSAKNGVVAQLRRDVNGANQRVTQLQSQLATRTTFETDLFPIAVGGRLTGRRIGLLFLGGPSDQIDGLVRDALPPAGGQLAAVAAVREPLDLNGLASAVVGTRYATLGTNPGLVSDFGARMAIQFVNGGPLIGRVRDRLLSSFNGQVGRIDGVVLVHNEPPGMQPAVAQSVSQFESGFVRGLGLLKVPTVGVEVSTTDPSQIPWFQSQNLSSVDDLDDLAGQTALIFALDGARGSYGSKPTAESLLPRAVGATTTP